MIPIFLTGQPQALSHPDEVVTQLKDCTKAMRRYPLHFCKPVGLAWLMRSRPAAFSEALAGL